MESRFSNDTTKRHPIDAVMGIVREVLDVEIPAYSARMFARMIDLKLNPLEVDKAVVSGNVVGYEVTPSRCELRLEIGATEGDMASFLAVVYLSMDHKFYVEDIRPRTPVASNSQEAV